MRRITIYLVAIAAWVLFKAASYSRFVRPAKRIHGRGAKLETTPDASGVYYTIKGTNKQGHFTYHVRNNRYYFMPLFYALVEMLTCTTTAARKEHIRPGSHGAMGAEFPGSLPEHFHDQQDELIQVVSGTVGVYELARPFLPSPPPCRPPLRAGPPNPPAAQIILPKTNFTKGITKTFSAGETVKITSGVRHYVYCARRAAACEFRVTMSPGGYSRRVSPPPTRVAAQSRGAALHRIESHRSRSFVENYSGLAHDYGGPAKIPALQAGPTKMPPGCPAQSLAPGGRRPPQARTPRLRCLSVSPHCPSATDGAHFRGRRREAAAGGVDGSGPPCLPHGLGAQAAGPQGAGF